MNKINIINLLQHFEWTKTYTKKHFGFNYSPICKICEYATKHFEQKTKNIINLNEFWNEEHCNNNFIIKQLFKKPFPFFTPLNWSHNYSVLQNSSNLW
ncbi:Glyco_tran_10_N domain-containing protein [Meloidogyne graminicola]|uniref:Glyco_tran_10_N domain-containing protein n=1 Tax=Meloidogyne graminicola TaxID=189291 RepID=A0A8S9ZJW3_9BILA|nr:Glyco_tran_10_N domain-containing protein [Meloidogyne graminicola]